jgi:uncharacterized protein (DUF1330 family)
LKRVAVLGGSCLRTATPHHLGHSRKRPEAAVQPRGDHDALSTGTKNLTAHVRLADTEPMSYTDKSRVDIKGTAMAKAYWVVTYDSIRNPDALAAYAKIATPAVQAAGGRFLVRGNPAKTYERGINQRVAVIEFDSMAQALAVYDNPTYQAAMKVLGDGVERDIRVVEGVG